MAAELVKTLDELKAQAPTLHAAAIEEGRKVGVAEAQAAAAVPKAATLAELKALGGSSDDVLASLDAGHTLAQAQAAVIASLRAKLETANATIADQQKKLEVAARGGGVAPLKLAVGQNGVADAGAGANGEADYDAAVRAVQAANPKWTNSQCVAEVNRTRPDLREAKFGNTRKKA